jgi:uncharacterized protein YjbJ (UPF0337 family)
MKLNIRFILLSLLSTLAISGCNQSAERNTAASETATGSIQSAAGELTNNDSLKSEGSKNKLNGDLRSAKEDVKDMITK